MRPSDGVKPGKPRDKDVGPSRDLSRDRRRQRHVNHDEIARAFERALAITDTQCDALRQALSNEDMTEVQRAAYALASAWLFTEAREMQIFARTSDRSSYKRFARKALIAANSVVMALFGEALAETSKWGALDPHWAELKRLRGVLCQLSTRVDVRRVDAAGFPWGSGSPASLRRA